MIVVRERLVKMVEFSYAVVGIYIFFMVVLSCFSFFLGCVNYTITFDKTFSERGRMEAAERVRKCLIWTICSFACGPAGAVHLYRMIKIAITKRPLDD